MVVVVGSIIVLLAVIGGFVLEGGPVLVLMQFAEFLIIGGSALGALLISTPGKLSRNILTKVVKSFKGGNFGKQTYLNLLKLMYDLFYLAHRKGLLALEPHIEAPRQSNIFNKYPNFLEQDHLLAFMTDTIRLMLLGAIGPYDIEALMHTDMETHYQEGKKPGMVLQKIGDSLPGLGIIAAVLGIVITMQSIGGPPEEIGHKVAAALVGTFLGVLISYGFIQPLATNIDLTSDEENRALEIVKAGIVAFAKDFPPITSVEFARRTIFSDYRPTFVEMEKMIREGYDDGKEE